MTRPSPPSIFSRERKRKKITITENISLFQLNPAKPFRHPAQNSYPTLHCLDGGREQSWRGRIVLIKGNAVLMKDANKVNSGPAPAAPDPPPINAHPNLESRIAPAQATENEVNDDPPPNRFSAVIEKIERLYTGKDSSDEEDLMDVPDDDQYDTEDSFIDDAELDEYFEVDNSAIKHDGFFVNRGKLERINEPPVVSNEKLKKRRRKDLLKAPNDSDDGRISNKLAKLGKSTVEKLALPPGKNSSNMSQNLTMISEQYENVKLQMKVSNGVAYASVAETNNIEKSKRKPKDASGLSDSSNQKSHEKSAYVQPKLQTAKLVNNADDLESSVRSKEKNGVCELPDLNLNISDGKIYTQAAISIHCNSAKSGTEDPDVVSKTSHVQRRDGSSVRPKSSILEKAIRELEKMVAESRPPTMENQETDTSAQGIKRRLPTEIKLKLAKVARLAASQGKMSKELLNRLMSILGHLIQLRTLKRNLKIMINTGLSAKQEKDDRFQQIKKEVAEMIMTHIPSVESNALVQQAGASDDFQEIGSEEKGALKKKFSMDAVLEDKICDLYDLFVEGLDEDSGSQVRKLYVELSQLWPSGLMDNHGIKRAICRAKERRRAVYCRNKDLEKIKSKKMLTPKHEEGVQVESGLVAQPHVQERLATEMAGPVLALASKPVSNSAVASVRLPSPSANGLVVDKLKEKLKGSSSNSMDESKMGVDGALTKKKVKRKPEQESDETHLGSEKLHPQSSGERQHPQSSGERHKSLKHASVLPQKLNPQSTAPSSFEPSS
ncbi:WOUND-RESPONSIVE FAMILY PROTEIN [Salix purpurea]|uniref:WOUND-RESPONSIVE FAMILY PROTEIN n=1 Tax=Salix purpurea TaxID=77065 RepID=A0A9Q0WXV1_SALPP|nr:WOUND-RESPONSIVE FAMILY PROTEIN [Salix purpurea]